MATPNAEKSKPNGSADQALRDIDAAAELPNIDGRESVMHELPKDLFVEGREEFEIAEEKVETDAVQYGRPGSQDIVHCHPDPARKKVVWGLKNKRGMGGKVYPVTQSLLKQYPRLRRFARLYVIRQYVTDEGVMGLWPAPIPDPLDDSSVNLDHLRAQEDAMNFWLRLEWVKAKDGGRWEIYRMTEGQFDDPIFPDERFDDVLRRGVVKITATDTTHQFVKHLLLGTPVRTAN
jgi:hypothetical protein